MPFLNITFVHVDFSFPDLLLTDNFFDPELKLKEHLTSKGILYGRANVSIFKLMVYYVVFMVVVAKIV